MSGSQAVVRVGMANSKTSSWHRPRRNTPVLLAGLNSPANGEAEHDQFGSQIQRLEVEAQMAVVRRS